MPRLAPLPREPSDFPDGPAEAVRRQGEREREQENHDEARVSGFARRGDDLDVGDCDGFGDGGMR